MGIAPPVLVHSRVAQQAEEYAVEDSDDEFVLLKWRTLRRGLAPFVLRCDLGVEPPPVHKTVSARDKQLLSSSLSLKLGRLKSTVSGIGGV